MKKNGVYVFIFAVSVSAVLFHAARLPQRSAPRRHKKDALVMDRHTLSSALISIFGEGGKPIVVRNIFELGSPIGGACDFYGMVYDENQKLTDPFQRCPAMISEINTPMFVKNNAVREAAVNKTCRLLTRNPALVAHALAASHLEPSAPVTTENIAKLHFSFYKEPMVENAAFAGGNWSEVAFSICSSAGWQVL